MIITEIQYFFSKIIRFQAIFKDTVEFTCALEFKISSQLKNAENMRFAGIFLCMFLFLFQGFGLVDIDTGHEPVKLSPGQISDFGLFPWPLVSSMYRQLFIDQYKTVSITEQGFDPVSAPAAEQKQRTGCRIQFQLIFHHGTEAVNGFAHIGIAADNVDPFQSGDIA